MGRGNKNAFENSIEIDGKYVGLTFSAIHFIKNHPKCGRLHGHDYTVRIRATGQIDESGMVIDFFNLEEPMRKILSSLDHKILVPKGCAVYQGDNVSFDTIDGRITVPKSSTYLIDVDETTAERLSSHLLSLLLNEICLDAKRIRQMEIDVLESEGRIGNARIIL